MAVAVGRVVPRPLWWRAVPSGRDVDALGRQARGGAGGVAVTGAHALSLALAGAGIFVVALGVMVAAVSVADFVVRALRRRFDTR